MNDVSVAPPSRESGSSIDQIVAIYQRGVDRTLLREALEMSPDERVRRMIELARFGETLRQAGEKAFR